MDGTTLVGLYSQASSDVRILVDRLLQAEEDDGAWARQLGPAYRQADVARLLGKTVSAVSQDRRLLKLPMRSGAVGYPAFQFDGRVLVPGVAEVVKALMPAVETPWTVASWLTSPRSGLGGRRPIDALRQGQVDDVLAAARDDTTALLR